MFWDECKSCALVPRGARVPFATKGRHRRFEGIEVVHQSEVRAFVLQWWPRQRWWPLGDGKNWLLQVTQPHTPRPPPPLSVSHLNSDGGRRGGRAVDERGRRSRRPLHTHPPDTHRRRAAAADRPAHALRSASPWQRRQRRPGQRRGRRWRPPQHWRQRRPLRRWRQRRRQRPRRHQGRGCHCQRRRERQQWRRRWWRQLPPLPPPPRPPPSGLSCEAAWDGTKPGRKSGAPSSGGSARRRARGARRPAAWRPRRRTPPQTPHTRNPHLEWPPLRRRRSPATRRASRAQTDEHAGGAGRQAGERADARARARGDKREEHAGSLALWRAADGRRRGWGGPVRRPTLGSPHATGKARVRHAA